MFGKWLPDLPSYNNPGLTEAKNVIPADATYKPYLPVLGTGTALAARPRGGASALDSSGNAFFYTGTETDLYVRAGTGWTDKSTAVTYTTAATGYWRFAQFDDLIIATNYADLPQRLAVGAGGNFANLHVTGTAPKARQIGVVGRFVVLGDTDEAVNGAVPSRLQWPAIDDPTNWQTPGSAGALAVQAGEQFLNAAYGAVTSIVGFDQYGIILQRMGVTRMRYVGGNIVWQFDVIDAQRGAAFPNATVQVGNTVYFASGDGFYATDGVSVMPIGELQVDNFFGDTIDSGFRERMYGAVDFANKCIQWTYPSSTSTAGRPNRVLIYNYEEKRWTRAEDECEVLVSGLTSAVSIDDLDALFGSIDIVTPSLDSSLWAGGNNTVLVFDSTYKLGSFSGLVGTAVLDGQEVELNPGLYTLIQGIKPLVTGESAALTVALGTRNSLQSSVSYSTPVAPTASTGFHDFLIEARYARARINIEGSFENAPGLLYQAVPAGAA